MKMYFSKKIFTRLLSFIVVFAVLLLIVVGQLLSATPKVYALETDCSVIEDLQERLKCLQKVQEDLQKQRKSLESEINKENKQQDELSRQIYSLNNQISLLELDVQAKQLMIEQMNLEINIISKEMEVISTDIAVVKQETTVLEAAVLSNLSEIYKTLNTDDIEVIFNNADVWGGINNVKYMQVVRQNDESKIINLVDKYVVLADYERILSSKQEEQVGKKVDVENEYGQLKIMQDDLVTQKSTRQALLNESQAREKEYKASLAVIQKDQNDVDAIVTQLVMELYNSGQLGAGVPVSKGDIIGFQGHTGCSLGSHLHFEIYTYVNGVKSSKNPYNYVTLSGGQVVSNNNYHAPMDNAVVTQNFHSGYCIDLVSDNSAYANIGQAYKLTDQELRDRCPHNPSRTEAWLTSWKTYGHWSVPYGIKEYSEPWSFGMRGESAPVYAIAAGTIYRSNQVPGGGNIVVINHGNNLFSLYLHLK